MEFLEEMFENTDRMGTSGSEQDVGYHQGGWNLEIDAPKLWDDKK